MGINYLNNKTWSQITREERYFCAHLFFLIRNDLQKFLEWFKSHHYSEMNLDKHWEIGYEVCFYRDYLFSIDESIKRTNYPPKRTFDLALFSEDELIIFEAKVYEDFAQDQIDSIEKDKATIHTEYSIRSLLKKDIVIKAYAIASEAYFKNSRTFQNKWLMPDKFDGRLSWKELADFYQDDILYRAEEVRTEKIIYKKR